MSPASILSLLSGGGRGDGPDETIKRLGTGFPKKKTGHIGADREGKILNGGPTYRVAGNLTDKKTEGMGKGGATKAGMGGGKKQLYQVSKPESRSKQHGQPTKNCNATKETTRSKTGMGYVDPGKGTVSRGPTGGGPGRHSEKKNPDPWGGGCGPSGGGRRGTHHRKGTVAKEGPTIRAAISLDRTKRIPSKIEIEACP